LDWGDGADGAVIGDGEWELAKEGPGFFVLLDVGVGGEGGGPGDVAMAGGWRCCGLR